MKNLKKIYGTDDPGAIKLRIIWMTLKEILIALVGSSDRNMKVIEHYDNHWKQCEKAERESTE